MVGDARGGDADEGPLPAPTCVRPAQRVPPTGRVQAPARSLARVDTVAAVQTGAREHSAGQK